MASTTQSSSSSPPATAALPPSSTSPAPTSSLETSDLPASPNPWSDAQGSSGDRDEPRGEGRPVTLPDSASLQQSIFSGLKSNSAPASPISKTPVSKDVLSEFDPLASVEEAAARQAWESSEGHPPPPRTPSPPPRTPSPPSTQDPSKAPPETPNTSMVASPTAIDTPSSSSSFPSLAALARTFAIPLARPRPQSLDAAKPVPSPATLSSFAAQQDASSRSDPRRDNASRSGTPSAAGSGTASPVPGARTDSKPAEGAFDFQKFLDQMKSRSAEPVSKYLRSFLSNFAKRTFTVNDQIKIINDFLVFIGEQMRNCDVWKNASETEFDNAMEGMEKLVMNRLYDFTFTPQLARATPPRPITTDDLEKDKVLAQRIALFGWIEEKHLDVPEGEGSKGFLMFAQQELLKINHYKAPRDKLICILNCCKVIFGLIRHLKMEEGADTFVPILIFVVLKANPEHLLSNVEFINRFRNPAKLQSEAGYYLSSLMGAVSFIETMDHTSLSNIDREEFERNVETAIRALPPSEPTSPIVSPPQSSRILAVPQSPHAGEESARPLALSTPSHSQSQTIGDDAKRLLQKTGDTISKPLNAIGRIFSEALDGAENKLAYLPGPFAPFELGREQRQQQQLQGGPQQQYQYTGQGPSSAPVSGGPLPPWALSPQGHQFPQTPQSAGVPQTPYGPQGDYAPPIQTPYKPRIKRPYSPSGYSPYPGSSPGASPGYGNPDETPSKVPYTNQPLAIGPSQPLLPPRVNYLAHSEGGGSGSLNAAASEIARTPTPNLDFAGVQAQIEASHKSREEEIERARAQLVQIFPGTDREVVDWVLEANDGDLGKSIESLLEMNSGE
ncbi:guanine nucleotide exchange factor Vps9 [Coprinopsis cinerea okayama7|uniref:Guanine nucleotide exchange factor Vps9 n=1 Tax=Coprinopsis cinerea (strain Okayama-7 / 130 / ATCC MYA-4618 / FGSC 9003) TaxID=240176 RepID=D6RNP8_COPC7|nr:guanine nucleotide exchange factor Vps9 [Coprinopsis cinerea okayama7\|eukprot:XP_002910841.1 guanine nucleotide exchange factor Vps9 [Coprinopsis cinerea okayama7\